MRLKTYYPAGHPTGEPDSNHLWGWGTCRLRDYLIWPTSEFSLPKLEHNIVS